MSDKIERDLKQAESFVRRSFEGIVGKYVNLHAQYENHEDADLIEVEYEKWLAHQLFGLLRLRNHEGRKAILVRLEELLNQMVEKGPGEAGKTEDHVDNALNKKTGSKPRPSAPAAAPTDEEPSVIEMVLNDGTAFPLYPSDVKRWEELYPAVDMMTQLRKMAGWCEANPKKRKTKSGIKRFINSWLAGAQDRGGGIYMPGTSPTDGMPMPLDGTAHPNGGIWMNGKQVLGVTPK